MRPRIRTVKPETWRDEKISALSHSARLLFIGLVTMADDEGRFRAPTNAILGDVFPNDPGAAKQLKGWVAEIKDSGMVLFYISDGLPYGAFRHWRKHQKINKAVPSELPPPPDPGVVRENYVPKPGVVRENYVPKPGESREKAGSVNGAIPDDSLPHAQARVPILSCSTEELSELGPDDVRALCGEFAALIRRNDPHADPAWESDRWFTDMRLLLRDRGWTRAAADEVQRVMHWTQDDDFERSNVLSPGKLRKRFTALLLKANKPPKPMNASAMLRAINGGSE